MKFFKNGAALLFLVAALGLSAAAQSEAGGAKGKVRNAKGDGLGGATVTARLKGEDVKSATADGKGNFQITGLAPGVYNFVFEKTGYAPGVKYNVEVKSRSTVDLGDRLILLVDQGTLVIINGSVYNQDGRSLTAAKVEIERINGDGSTKKIATAYTSVSGEFTLRQPDAAARYRVTATLKGVSASKELTVDGAGIYRLAIMLNLPKEEK